MNRILYTLIVILLAFHTNACVVDFRYVVAPEDSSALTVQFYRGGDAIPIPSLIQDYTFDFGDGTPRYTTSTYSLFFYTFHTYSSPGTYNVKLIANVRDTFNGNLVVYCRDSVVKTVTVTGNKCVSTIVPTATSAARYITFEGSTVSVDEDSMLYKWEFGDGDTASGKKKTHAYNLMGTYKCFMTASSAKYNCSYKDSITVEIDTTFNCSRAKALFAVGNSSNKQIILDNQSIAPRINASTSNTITRTIWDYGDGVIGTSIGHTYANTGTYTIKAMVKWMEKADTTIFCTDTSAVVFELKGLDCASGDAKFTVTTDNLLVNTDASTSVAPPNTTIIRYEYNYDGVITPLTLNKSKMYPSLPPYDGGPWEYNIYMRATWYGPPGTNATCTDTAWRKVKVALFNCPGAKVSFANTTNKNTVNIYPNQTPPMTAVTGYYTTDYGDSGIYTTALTHTYAQSGTYRVTYKGVWKNPVDTTIICSDTFAKTITVVDFKCPDANASFTATVVNDSSVRLNNTATLPAPNAIKRYTYNYGDNKPATADTTHTYKATGTYKILQTAIWKNPLDTTITCTDTTSQFVTVFNANTFTCVNARAAFTYNTDDSSVMVTNTSTPPSANAMTSSTFDYGDGSIITQSNRHVYTTQGTYTVHMTMLWKNPEDTTVTCTATISHNVTINNNNAFNCYNAQASFNAAVFNDSVTVQNTSATAGINSVSTYTYKYGDGSPATSATTHKYTTPGTYIIEMNATWRNIMNTSVSCAADAYDTITIAAPFNCATADAAFTATVNNYDVTINNTSTSPTGTALPRHTYDYGDGSATTSSINHTYTTAGAYTILLTALWKNAADTTISCTDTASKTVTITTPPPGINTIQGTVRGSVTNTFYKVWLISYDTVSLTAIDSVTINTPAGTDTASFRFDNEPNDHYFIKAQDINNTPAHIPTYSINSAYWSGAAHIYHTGTQVYGQDINMLPGTPAPGPGFIGGSISAGANRLGRRTGNDVTDILILLRDNAGIPIGSVRTDVNGNYYFANIAAGNYDIYPELPGYSTVVFPISVGMGHDSAESINFHINTKSKTVTPAPTGVHKVTVQQTEIYPNPTTGVVTITNLQANAHISVTDVVGNEIMALAGSALTNGQLDLSSLHTGIYFINIKGEDMNYTSKLILNK